METVKWYEDRVYIKMSDCPEIQGIVVERIKRDDGWLRTSAVGSIINAIAKNGEVFTFYEDIWLPDQSQLQAMVLPLYQTLEGLFTRFRDEYALIDEDGTFSVFLKGFTSYEQLWLAFVMKELHNKVWDGDKWV